MWYKTQDVSLSTIKEIESYYDALIDLLLVLLY